MQLKSNSIVFDNPTGKYLPGQLVTGKVEFTLKKETFVTEISAKFKGVALTNCNGVEKAGEWRYFEEEAVIYRATDPRNALQHGNHSHPFSYRLPATIPPSFYSQSSSITYSVKITAKVANQTSPMTKKEFIVVKKMGSNEWRHMENQLSNSFVLGIRIPAFIGNNGDVSFMGKFNEKIYQPGQKGTFFTTIANKSSKSLQYLSIELCRQVHCFSSSSFCQFRKLTVMKKDNLYLGIPSGDQLHNKTFELTIPVTCCPSFDSEMIKVSYFYRFTLESGTFFQTRSQFEREIYIGIKKEEEEEEEIVVEPNTTRGHMTYRRPPLFNRNRVVDLVTRQEETVVENRDIPPTYSQVMNQEDGGPPTYAETIRN